MRRREFLGFVAGAAAAWPLAARAQRSKTFRVGVLANEKWPPLDGLRDGLRSLGYVEGRNLEFVNRYVEGETAKYPSFAAELVGLPVDVIVTWGTPASLAAKDATATIPIIMTSGDPRRCRSGSWSRSTARQRYRVLNASRRARGQTT